MKLRSLLTAVFLLSTPLLPAVAAEGTTPPLETVGLAEELLTVLRVEESMKDSLAEMNKMQDQILSGLSPEAKAQHSAIMESVAGAQATNWARMKPMFVEIYATTFSAEELRGMIEFFKTPVGQAWIEKQPEVQQKTMQKIQDMILQSQPKMIEDMMKLLKSGGPQKGE